LQSRTCLFLQLFFAIAAHQQFATTLSRMFAITCIFFTKLQPHQAKTNLVTSSFLPVFCNRNHTAIRMQSHCDKICNQLHSSLQLSFFAITAHESLQTHCKGCCNHQFFDQVATHQGKTTLAAILQCRGTELFFETGVFCTRVFLKLFFLQNHCCKVAITLL
jgi:hypothetical protein